MTKYAHSDVLDNGPGYVKTNCNKVILTNAYTNVYATANTTAKVAEATLVTGDFALSGADGAARVLTATLIGKAGGNALIAVADGTNMHFVFVDTVSSKVLYVTEESSNQAITAGNPVTFNGDPTYTSGQPV